jgi:hypothetical protein
VLYAYVKTFLPELTFACAWHFRAYF